MKKDSEQLRKQNDELMSMVKERQTLLKINTGLRQKLSAYEAKLKSQAEYIEKTGKIAFKGKRVWHLTKARDRKALTRAFSKWVVSAKPTVSVTQNLKLSELKLRSKALFSGLLACVYSHFSLSPLVLRLRGSYISLPWLQMLFESCSGDLLEVTHR